MKLSNEDLLKVEGGGISFGVGLAIVSGLIFIGGLVSGYMNPKSCNVD